MKAEMELFVFFVASRTAKRECLVLEKILLFYYLRQKLAKTESASAISDEQLLRALADRLGFDIVAR